MIGVLDPSDSPASVKYFDSTLLAGDSGWQKRNLDVTLG
jgi:hypothetical protein